VCASLSPERKAHTHAHTHSLVLWFCVCVCAFLEREKGTHTNTKPHTHTHTHTRTHTHTHTHIHMHTHTPIQRSPWREHHALTHHAAFWNSQVRTAPFVIIQNPKPHFGCWKNVALAVRANPKPKAAFGFRINPKPHLGLGLRPTATWPGANPTCGVSELVRTNSAKCYGAATASRIDQITGLLCRISFFYRALVQKRRTFNRSYSPEPPHNPKRESTFWSAKCSCTCAHPTLESALL